MDISHLFNPGLYQITCLKNNKVYIGQSSNVLSRLGRHVDNLENNRHDCSDLQNDFNCYGKAFFTFESLELNINSKVRKDKEKQLIKKHKKTYNLKSHSGWNFYSQKVKIKNKIYPSLRQASLLTGESRTHLTRKCKTARSKDYLFLEKTDDKKLSKRNSICVTIDNVFYNSISQAASTLKKSPATIKKRCQSEKYPNYSFSV